MIQIEGFEISYFRSIYSVKVRKIQDFAIFCGKNDSGKSNVLKALNLFFNNKTDWQDSFNFYRDFSKKRLTEVRRDTIKGRQFVRITVHFIRGDRSQISLPETFSVTKTWYRESAAPEIRSSLDRQFKSSNLTTTLHRAKAGLQRYLGTIRFEYIPAVKDRAFFTYVLGLLQDTILTKKSGESDVAAAVNSLNTSVESEARELRREFQEVCGIPIDIKLPSELDELFRAFTVATASGRDDMPLFLRGDGIQSRFIPSLLHYISTHSKLYYLWGFEEPENCLEHARATRLATDIQSTYSKKAQVLVTTHSPAFISQNEANVSLYRVVQVDQGTSLLRIRPDPEEQTADHGSQLQVELGLMAFQQEQQAEYNAKLQELQEQSRKAQDIRREAEKQSSPVILTEGKWDVIILNTAWEKLYGSKEMHFRVISCDPADGLSGGSAGVSTMVTALESVRPDEPPTIGILDNDEAGADGFKKLSRNFEEVENSSILKIQKTGNAGAVLLPCVPGREQFVLAQNFPLEYYFDEQFLLQKAAGTGLEFTYPEAIERFGSRVVNRRRMSEFQYRQIVASSKSAFAENVVRILPAEAFAPFQLLFQQIESLLSLLRARKSVVASRKLKTPSQLVQPNSLA